MGKKKPRRERKTKCVVCGKLDIIPKWDNGVCLMCIATDNGKKRMARINGGSDER